MTMRNYQKIGKQGGFTMLEVSIAIVIGLTIMIGVFMVVQSTRESSNATREANNVMLLKNIVTSTYPTPDYTGLTNTVLLSTKKVPDVLKGSGAGEIKNAWGKNITIAVDTGDSGRYTITTEDVPTSECTTLVPIIASNFAGVKVGTTTIKSDTVAYKQSNVISACAPASLGAGVVDIELADS